MNLLLLFAEELDETGSVVLHGRRARHLLSVLKVSQGQPVRAGRVNGDLGTARVLDVSRDSVTVRYEAGGVVPRPERCLLLAVPRPKVLSRCLEHAAALGYGRILLFRSYRVDKAHLSSHKLSPDDMNRHLLLGLEQGLRVHLPEVEVFSRFRPFVEDRLPTLVPEGHRFVAHPTATNTTLELTPWEGSFTLALGPEGGFIPWEIAALAACGFTPIRAEIGPLRVESALSYLSGQFDWLARSGDGRARRVLDAEP